MQHGGVAFDRIYGMDFFEYLNQHPQQGAAFHTNMTDRSRREAADVVAAYDFGEFERLVDVGGGQGVLLEAILTAAPRTRGILMDQQTAVEEARKRLIGTEVLDRCTFVPGDFFVEVPPGGDAYVLQRVIHDWDDESAVRILANCRAATGNNCTLLLVEAVLPELAREHPSVTQMDLMILMLGTGRERTEVEYEQLLGAAGFRLARIVPTASQVGICLIEAAPI